MSAKEKQTVEEIFSDPEARENIVNLFALALKIAEKKPELWAKINQQNND